MKISFLGGGNMASALIGGLIAKGYAPADIQVAEIDAAGRSALRARFSVRAVPELDALALACDVLVLAVKPQQLRAALAPLAGRLDRQLVLSIAAGVRMADISRWLDGHARIVRAMPNTPALIGRGITGLVAATTVEKADRDRAGHIMDAVGESLWVNDEASMDAVTAVSGSGPAYFFYFIEVMIAGARALGLDAETARKLVLATASGAAELAASSQDAVATLRARVTSKGGTTAAALEVMQDGGLDGLVLRALRAAATRGRELGDEMGDDHGVNPSERPASSKHTRTLPTEE